MPCKTLGQPRVGEVYLLQFEGYGQEQQGLRPAVIISNNKGNFYSPNVIVLPMTTSLKKINQPTHVVITARDSGLQKDSMVLCENPVCVSKKKLTKLLTKLDHKQMAKISCAYLLATGLMGSISEDELITIRNRAVSLDAT